MDSNGRHNIMTQNVSVHPVVNGVIFVCFFDDDFLFLCSPEIKLLHHISGSQSNLKGPGKHQFPP